MTTIQYTFRHVIPAAFACLPEKMRSPHAAALLLSIGLQESKFKHRVQIGGPALGFWQFEAGGAVKGVHTHPATKDHLLVALDALCYKRTLTNRNLHRALEHNDVLACVFARLNIWWLPAPLPASHEVDAAWAQYLIAWNPGRPHRDTWDAHYRHAWTIVNSALET